MSVQSALAAALLDPDAPCPVGLTAWNGSDPARRFAVYRNNVVVSLIDALAATFPVTLELVGEEFFRAMAGVFVRAVPPTSALLAEYGGGTYFSHSDPDRLGDPLLGPGAAGHDPGDPVLRLSRRISHPRRLGHRVVVFDRERAGGALRRSLDRPAVWFLIIRARAATNAFFADASKFGGTA